MAEEVGTAFVSILPSLKGFSSVLRRELRSQLAVVDGPAADAGHRAGSSFSHAMQSRISAASAAIGSAVRSAVTAASVAVAIGLAGITGFGLKSAAQLEQTQIGFEALLGSADEAKTVLGDLQQFAATTPFEFAGIADAGRRILAFSTSVGIARSELIPTLTTIGDLVSVLGGTQQSIDSVVRALGQIASKGKVSQEELLQLAEALPGFNANAAIAASLGLSVADSMKAITAGEVSATEGINGLLAGMAAFPGAAGAMEKQSQTLLGVFSTFKDTMSIALTEAFKSSIPEIKSQLTSLTPVFGGVLDQLAPSLGNLLTVLLPFLGLLTQALTPVLLPLLEGLGTVVTQLKPALVPLGDALAQVVAAILPLVGPLAIVVEQFVRQGLVPAILQLVPAITELTPSLSDLLIALLPVIPPLGQLLAAVVSLIVPLAQLGASGLTAVVGFLEHIRAFEAFAAGLEQISFAVQGLAGWLSFLFGRDWGAEWGKFTGAISGAWDAVTGFFRDLPGRISTFLSNLPAMLGNLAREAFERLSFAVGFGIGRVIRFFADLPGNVANFVVQLWGRVTGLFAAGVENARSAAVGGFERFLQFMRELPGRAMTFLRELPSRLASLATELSTRAYQLGRDLVQGAINGIKSLIGNIASTLKGGFDNAVAGVKRGLGIASPSKVFADIGEDTVTGYVKGIEATARQAQDAVTTALRAPMAGSPTRFAPAPAATGTAPIYLDNYIQIGDEVTRVVSTQIDESNRDLRRRVRSR